MADKLIIVESPAKANTIKKFIGGSTKVMASMGHIRDLPKSRLGVLTDQDFDPEYINIRGKGDLIKKLKAEAVKAKKIYLATDPDREGEAIAWHLAHILDVPLDSDSRITFNEVTKEAVRTAVKNPRKIDLDLTDAQQARRVLDRIVGYKMSPILWKKVRRGLSAGRVQSVAVRLIVEREEEIDKFIPEEYWNIYAKLEAENKEFEARLYGYKDKKIELHKKLEVDNILSELDKAKYIVDEVKKGTRKKNPAAPFTTSTMQQEASRKLGYTLRKTMAVAQGLYEGVKVPEMGSVGLITYMRTDSTRISEEARGWAKEYIEKTYGEEYYENRYYKSKGGEQDAHEAIRPTYASLSPDSIKESLTNDQYKLYKLIYNRFMASQMATAIYNTIAVKINANDYNFRASGQSIKFKGFMTLYIEGRDDNSTEDEEKTIPELKEKEEVKKNEINGIQSFTEPPARYTEASLVKALEEKGIGRPSTYAPTISTIIDRLYVEKEQKQLRPTDLGKIVNNLLVENFGDVINVEFTAQVEERFDEVEAGKENWKNIIKEFYYPFMEKVEKVEAELEHVELEEEVSEEICDKCGKNLVVKFGRYGKFLACPGFPDCKNIKPYVTYIEEPCPKCEARIQIRKTRKKRIFYICEKNENNETTCDYISWNKPKKGEENVEDTKELKEEISKKKTAKKAVKKKSVSKATKKKTTKKKK